MKKSRTPGRWISDNTTLKVLSLLMAVICWFAVAMTDTSSITSRVKDVPINIQVQEKTLQQLGLSIIDMDETLVTAQVRGDRLAVTQLEPDDLTATLQLISADTEPGTYDLQVVPASTTTSNLGVQNKTYEIIGYTPSKIQVKLDRLQTRTFKVDADIEGTFVVPDGFIQRDIALSPEEVQITGPEEELDRIDHVKVTMEGDLTLEKTYGAVLGVELYDIEGLPINPAKSHLTLDHEEIQVTIPVLKEKDLPLRVEFLNTPRNFPTDDLPYTMSNYEVAVAGPVDVVDKHNVLLLGHIDLAEVNLENSSFVFDLNLPNGFTNVDGIHTVTVNFNTQNLAEATFTVDNVLLLNVPPAYDVSLVTDKVYNVTMVGNADIISQLTAEDLVAELNFADKKDLSLGQYQSPVRISAPTKGLVWAAGDYNVVVQVSQK